MKSRKNNGCESESDIFKEKVCKSDSWETLPNDSTVATESKRILLMIQTTYSSEEKDELE